MTNEEAIKEIRLWLDKCPYETTCEAFDLAIKSLSELKIVEFKGCDNCELDRPSGEWLVKNKGTTHYNYCSICSNPGDFFDKYCRHCGAKMQYGAEP